MAVALAVHAAITFSDTRARFLGLLGADAHRCSRLILHATHDRMLLGSATDVQRTVDELAAGGNVTGIRIYDSHGRITQATRAAEIGTRVSRDGAPCRECHVAVGGGTLRPPASKDAVMTVDGQRVLRHLAVIPNEARCSSAGCHPPPPAHPVLGLMEVELSMEPLDSAVSAARRRTVWSIAVLVLLTGGVSAAIVQRLVHRPVKRLHEGTQRIARGELDHPVVVEGRDELADLGAAFNRMAAEVKSARDEVTDWSHRLEAKVVAKTDELRRTQRQVTHMERMASLGKLAATVAHELNNPLSGILACARLVERELAGMAMPDAQRAELTQNLRLIADECARCGTIVKNLLVFARRSAGARAPVDLHDVADRSLMLVRHHLEMHGIELRRELMANDPVVVADGAQIQQALVALLVNAVEAITAVHERGGTLMLLVEDDADAVTLQIGDTGVGIAPEVIPHIFEPFFSTKDRESGVGLGLAVVYGIVEAHGGTIDVESAPGHGATFRVRLPRRMLQAATPPHATEGP